MEASVQGVDYLGHLCGSNYMMQRLGGSRSLPISGIYKCVKIVQLSSVCASKEQLHQTLYTAHCHKQFNRNLEVIGLIHRPHTQLIVVSRTDTLLH